MRKLLSISLLVAAWVLYAGLSTEGVPVGWLPQAPDVGNDLFSFNASTSRAAYGFLAKQSKTLSKVLVYVSGVTGTLGANDIVCDLYSTNTTTGNPNASIQSRNTVTSVPTGTTWVEVTGFTSSLTAGTYYYLVFRNANGTPASNYWNASWTYSYGGPFSYTTNYTIGKGNSYFVLKSTDGGSTWSTGDGNVAPAMRLEYSDGTFDGLPALADPSATYETQGAYGANEIGARITIPSGVSLRVIGVVAFTGKIGSPTGNLTFRIRKAEGTPTDTAAIPSALLGNTYFRAYFSTVQTMDAGTWQVTLKDSAADDASNYFKLTAPYLMHNSAASQGLFPFGGFRKAYYNGSTWTYTDTRLFCMGLILDGGQLMNASGGGGGAWTWVQ
jgi:hypothetical protein